jgi:hypothetical protein
MGFNNSINSSTNVETNLRQFNVACGKGLVYTATCPGCNNYLEWVSAGFNGSNPGKFRWDGHKFLVADNSICLALYRFKDTGTDRSVQKAVFDIIERINDI